MNPYIKYLATLAYTEPIAPALAIVPKNKPATNTVTPVIRCSRYLGTRELRLPDGRYVTRDMWTAAHFEFVEYIGSEYTRIRDRYGVLTLPRNQVRVLDNGLLERKIA